MSSSRDVMAVVLIKCGSVLGFSFWLENVEDIVLVPLVILLPYCYF